MDNKYVQQFKKGSLEMILLSLIGRKETYGYEIITELNSSASVLGSVQTYTHYLEVIITISDDFLNFLCYTVLNTG